MDAVVETCSHAGGDLCALEAVPERVCFNFGTERRQYRTISLRNTGARRLAIKIRTTSRNAIKVDVTYRFLDPGCTTVVRVVRLPLSNSWRANSMDRISFYYVTTDYSEEFAINAYKKEEFFKREIVKVVYRSDDAGC
ncbi:hypothetical protein M514_10564, partial [Trichuris suis]